MHIFGYDLDTGRPVAWLVAAVLAVGGAIAARRTWTIVARAWDQAMTAARAKGYLA
jgi:branched-chain amino acid transport system permease protein